MRSPGALSVPSAVRQPFDAYLAARMSGTGPRLDPSGLVDLDSIRFTENLLAGAIGAASARVVIAASLEGHSLSRRAAMAMLDEASEALRFNRSLLQSTLESVPQGICAFDAEFNITAWNGRFIALLDLPPDFVRVGLPLAELIAFNVERGEYAASEFAALLVNRDVATQSWPYLYERKRPDGTVLEIVYDRAAEGGYVSTYTDVTERHRAAEALRHANEDLELRVRERTEALEQAKAGGRAGQSRQDPFPGGGQPRSAAAAERGASVPVGARREPAASRSRRWPTRSGPWRAARSRRCARPNTCSTGCSTSPPMMPAPFAPSRSTFRSRICSRS